MSSMSDPAVEELVGLDVAIRVRLAGFFADRPPPGKNRDVRRIDAREAGPVVKQLAQVFGGEFGDAVDVLGDRAPRPR